MEYVKLLIKAHKALLKKVKALEEENKVLQSNEANDSIYYDKYNKVNAEKLALENQIAKLELESYAKDRELEKRNITIKNLQSELQNK